MRRDWLSTHVAAAVAAPFVLAMQPAEAAAANAEPAASTMLAQAAGPGSAISAPSDTAPAASAPVKTASTDAASTTGVGSAEPAAARNLDNPEDVGPAAPEGQMPFVPRGDDELPSTENIKENPYLRAASTDGSQEGGVTSSGQEYGAFVPPSGTKAQEVRGSEAGTEMQTILGEEVYNRRVNITTPPDTDVAEVVRILAERANLNFVYGEGIIKGRVTLNLRDVPLGVALQSLLSSQDLVIIREGANVMRIAPRREVKTTNVDTRTIYIKLNWVLAPAMAQTLGQIMPGGVGSIKAHTESNTLIITDTAPNVALLRDLVTQLDVPEKQVMIEARMIELLLSNNRTLGSSTRLERRDSSGNSPILGTLGSNGPRTITQNVVTMGPNNVPIITPTTKDVPANPVDALVSSLASPSGATQFGFGGVVSILGAQFDVAATLDGLETRNMVNTLAAPRVITLNNQPANIDIQREVPYLEAQQGSAQQVVAATVKFKDAGIRLEVLPVITNNGYIRMQLTPEQRILAGNFFNPTTGSNIPIVDRRTAVTNVIVKDEDTVVLAGLREVDAADTKAQTPWLGQVPIIGWFFKNDLKTHTKTDLMLFVTPHIVKSPVMTPAENYKYTRVDAHWDLPDFFFDDSVDQRESRHRFEADQNPRDYYPDTMKLPPPAAVTTDMLNTQTSTVTTSETVSTESFTGNEK